jgi:hypothetical protein
MARDAVTARHGRSDLVRSLDEAVDRAAKDLVDYAGMPRGKHVVISGDARSALRRVPQADVAIFSPPYPNSFDYTDVYNLELWMLGYLDSKSSNTDLRRRTLRSHVQTRWKSAPRLAQSRTLERTTKLLAGAREGLWDPNIPEMVGYYFDDLYKIFQHLWRILPQGHHAIVAIGDSQYAGIHINAAAILSECVESIGFHLQDSGAIRSMRNSSQHGGDFRLAEHCLVFRRM